MRQAHDWDACPGHCATCGGTGQVEDVRRGVSACRSVEALYEYLSGRYASRLGQSVIVEMEADLAAEDDWDAADGAVLVLPTRIVSVTPVDPSMVEDPEEEEWA
jgi:hypothetical protein